MGIIVIYNDVKVKRYPMALSLDKLKMLMRVY